MFSEHGSDLSKYLVSQVDTFVEFRRNTGETTRIVERLKDGDVFIAANRNTAVGIQHKLKTEKGINIKIGSASTYTGLIETLKRITIGVYPRPNVYLDHTAIEAIHRDSIRVLEKELSKIEDRSVRDSISGPLY